VKLTVPFGNAPAGGAVIAIPLMARLRFPVKVAPLASVTFNGILKGFWPVPAVGVPEMVAVVPVVGDAGLRLKP